MPITVSSGTTKGRLNDAWGARRISIFSLTLINPYAAGGLAFDPKASGHVGKVEHVLIFPRVDAATGATTAAGRVFIYDYTNKKIVAYQQKDPAAAGGSDIPLPECGAIDLSGTKLSVIVISD